MQASPSSYTTASRSSTARSSANAYLKPGACEATSSMSHCIRQTVRRPSTSLAFTWQSAPRKEKTYTPTLKPKARNVEPQELPSSPLVTGMQHSLIQTAKQARSRLTQTTLTGCTGNGANKEASPQWEACHPPDPTPSTSHEGTNPRIQAGLMTYSTLHTLGANHSARDLKPHMRLEA